MPARLQIDHAMLGNHRWLPIRISNPFIRLRGFLPISHPLFKTHNYLRTNINAHLQDHETGKHPATSNSKHLECFPPINQFHVSPPDNLIIQQQTYQLNRWGDYIFEMLVSICESLLQIAVGWGFIPHRRWRHIKCHRTSLGLPLFIELIQLNPTDFALPVK